MQTSPFVSFISLVETTTSWCLIFKQNCLADIKADKDSALCSLWQCCIQRC